MIMLKMSLKHHIHIGVRRSVETSDTSPDYPEILLLNITIESLKPNSLSVWLIGNETTTNKQISKSEY